MSATRIMLWVDQLPNVASTTFQGRRNQIGELMREAEELSRKAEALRSKVYFQSLALEADAKGNWSHEEIELAKRCTG